MRILVLLFCLMFALPAFAQDRLLVFAAASQRDALEQISKLYEEECTCDVVLSFAATSTLARQIDAGAKADAFVSANEAWADWLQIRGRLENQTRAVIAGNRLAIASTDEAQDGVSILMRGRFAMADPISVPAGIYAREALEAMGIWQDVRQNAVFSENVRVALSSVRRGDLLSGIVYLSDLVQAKQVHSHFVFPENTHAPIHYVAASVKGSSTGPQFVEFLKTETAQDVLKRYGFLSVPATH